MISSQTTKVYFAQVNRRRYLSLRTAVHAEARAALAAPDWVRVEDALPVVPEGADFVNVWVCLSARGKIIKHDWDKYSHEYSPKMAHWQYNLTPQPPETTK